MEDKERFALFHSTSSRRMSSSEEIWSVYKAILTSNGSRKNFDRLLINREEKTRKNVISREILRKHIYFLILQLAFTCSLLIYQ